MSSGRIMVADDSMVVRAVLRKQLAVDAHEVIEVASGEEVLETCRVSPPDVVLLDVEMPGMSGYQVLSVMQTDPALAAIPVIFLSGRVSADDVATGLRLGAHDYLRKPVETDELLARVTAALRIKQRHDELKRDVASLREVAPVDAVTGMLDAAALASRIASWASGDAGSDDRLLGGVLLMVDSFDAVTHAHGVDAAEEVLRKVADAVRADLRGADVIGRCGPKELLVLLPNTERGAAHAVADRLRDIAERTPVLVGDELLTVSVSIGVAVTADGDRTAFVQDLQAAVANDRAARNGSHAVSPPPPPPSEPTIEDLRGRLSAAEQVRWTKRIFGGNR